MVADRPGVGKHLMEHPGVNFGFYLKPRGAAAEIPAPSDVRRAALVVRLDGCPPGDMYLIPSNKAQWHAIGDRLGLMMLWVNRSYSEGEIRLTARDRSAPLDIDFNMCSDPRDLERLVLGTRLMCRLQADTAVQDTVEQGVSDQLQRLGAAAGGAHAVQRRADLGRRHADGFLGRAAALHDRQADRGRALDRRPRPRRRRLPGLDPRDGGRPLACVLYLSHGRARRRPSPSPILRRASIGIEGLRVGDASIMPMVPCANTNIPTIMIGEKVAATILAEH